MSQNNAANVIDLEAFRQRKARDERPSDEMSSASLSSEASPMVVPVWFCWVPMWTPFVG
jgi:hypothetical protein